MSRKGEKVRGFLRAIAIMIGVGLDLAVLVYSAAFIVLGCLGLLVLAFVRPEAIRILIANPSMAWLPSFARGGPVRFAISASAVPIPVSFILMDASQPTSGDPVRD